MVYQIYGHQIHTLQEQNLQNLLTSLHPQQAWEYIEIKRFDILSCKFMFSPKFNVCAYYYSNQIGINSNALIISLLRMMLTIGCPMKFHHYPMDKQECNLTLQSCKFNITYKWTTKYYLIPKRPLKIQHVENIRYFSWLWCYIQRIWLVSTTNSPQQYTPRQSRCWHRTFQRYIRFWG